MNVPPQVRFPRSQQDSGESSGRIRAEPNRVSANHSPVLLLFIHHGSIRRSLPEEDRTCRTLITPYCTITNLSIHNKQSSPHSVIEQSPWLALQLPHPRQYPVCLPLFAPPPSPSLLNHTNDPFPPISGPFHWTVDTSLQARLLRWLERRFPG